MLHTYVHKPAELRRDGRSGFLIGFKVAAEVVVVHEEIYISRERQVAHLGREGTGEVVVGDLEAVREPRELSRGSRSEVSGSMRFWTQMVR